MHRKTKIEKIKRTVVGNNPKNSPKVQIPYLVIMLAFCR